MEFYRLFVNKLYIRYIHKLNSRNLLFNLLIFRFFFFFSLSLIINITFKETKSKLCRYSIIIQWMLVANILESRSNKRRQNLGVGSVRTQLKTARTRPCFWLCQHPLPDNGRPRGIVWHACVHCVYGYYFMVILTNRCNTCVCVCVHHARAVRC